MAEPGLITRRAALLGALTSSALVVPAAAVQLAAPAMTAQERYDHHLAEFQKAAAELDPAINRWSVASRGNTLSVTAFRVTGRYDGDGFYEFRSPIGTKYVDHVSLSSERIDGERSFALRRWPGYGPAYNRMTESCLCESIGAKV
jgi:hypothetical protein